MTPRPLYRWKSFWFGVLVVVFVGWVYAHSFREKNGAVLYVPGGFYAVHFFGGEVFLVTGPTAAGGYYVTAMPPERIDNRGWAATLNTIRSHGSKVSRCSLWVACSPFILAWLAWLVWRWRAVTKGQRMQPPAVIRR